MSRNDKIKHMPQGMPPGPIKSKIIGYTQISRTWDDRRPFRPPARFFLPIPRYPMYRCRHEFQGWSGDINFAELEPRIEPRLSHCPGNQAEVRRRAGLQGGHALSRPARSGSKG